ncbi:asparagine synthase (glutamine-hydrolyzing) [Hyphomicrobium sulfonivorans]|uniref:asparagine synthase (glutamine-hydrolyzing) n=1 Tax=Hyphomicrobium sulfonivorans TaxID=121290 RepID=UPI00156E3A9F|nr:asparagine synthase (glutamine-hydrolyzing) [Hyphomicrobium sulfonivorans]MBI1649846.1 asparagine synthase (glutamine-hydrolyzing) [Hyphomicrobium sulfonivorans]NSL71759.1 asparagine synthase (glutamine-hydrolyzing) [Hyphomicrobium sulfonivorans]
MCGIVGYLGLPGSASKNANAVLEVMARAIEARGPDDHGAWHDHDAGIGLGHRRLAIVDLSPAGHQPMTAASGRFVLVFNGEIYNHLALREALNEEHGIDWRGHSDTETLLAAFDAWGIESTVKRCEGMFAFAVWNRQNRSLTLGRDRAGEKPLYYGWQGSGSDRTLLFGSELKALKAHPTFNGAINRDAITLLLRHNYIPAPYSIYEGISKLPPATLATFEWSECTGGEAMLTEYWSLRKAAEPRRRSPAAAPRAAVAELDSLLHSVIGQQMIADVPLGAFLSGGVDSSTIVAIMQRLSDKPIKTFTIGFAEERFDEAPYAKKVAEHLGTHHTELYVSPEQALAIIPKLPEIYCEPFSDSSQVPTYLVSALTREHVTVALSGDAGDELFAGYSRYQATADVWGKLSRIPRSMRQLGSVGMTMLSPDVWNRLADHVPSLKRRLGNNVGDKLHKASSVLASEGIGDLYRGLVSHWHTPSQVVLGGSEPSTQLTHPSPDLMRLDPIERMMFLDFMSYLPDDILTKVDRASMAVSLETRVPFLDHRVIEFAWSLPLDYKLRNGEGKWILRQVLDNYVPRSLIERPKMGFGIPLDSWLRGPLRDWAETLLSEERLIREGFFAPAPIRQKWQEHVRGSRNWAYHLWNILMFQAWLENECA